VEKELKENGKAGLRRIFGIVSVCAVCLAVPSCATKAVLRQQEFAKTIDAGDYLATIDKIKAKSKKLYGETNAFLYYMDIGILYHYAGHYDSSNVYLLKASDVYDELFARSVTNEVAAVITNDNVRPYRAKPYELVFMHQITAFNFMQAGKFDEALVETRKVQLYFDEWQRTVAKDKKYHSDGMFHLFSSLAYERADEESNSLISLYKSVEAYKMGPVPLPVEIRGFAYDRLTAGDREDDVKTLALTPYDGANRWDAKQGQAEIVIIGYAGNGPNLIGQYWSGTYISGGLLVLTSSTTGKNAKGDVITLPAPALPPGSGNSKRGMTTSITVSLPKLETTPSRTSYFQARLGDKKYKSVVVNDIDKQTEKALADAWNDIIMRTVVRVVLKTIGTQSAKSLLINTGNKDADILFSLIGDIAAGQLEKADTRMCFLLPQKVHAIRIPVEPGTHTVALDVYDGGGSVIGKKEYKDVSVGRGEKKVLFHSSLR
jgi:hypothetical protein